MKTLVLYSSYTDQLSYFDDWIDAFRNHNAYNAETVNVGAKTSNQAAIFRKIEKEADVIILHHSMNGDTLRFLKPYISALKQRKGKLVSFVGNEVNLPGLGMADKIRVLRELNTDIIASQLLQEAAEWLYQECVETNIISLPHALNIEAFRAHTPYQDRSIDIGTRSARYGAYLGDNDRNKIIKFIEEAAPPYDLTVDLGLKPGSQKRFNRYEWANFLNSCKATLSTEAGSFYLERDDQTVKEIQAYLKKISKKIIVDEESFLRKIYRTSIPSFLRKRLFSWLKQSTTEIHELGAEQNFEDIQNIFFMNRQPCPMYSKAISSRHFDAIGTKTLHIMYPGRYNDILQPGEHYFCLHKDHSNIDELVSFLKDPTLVQNTVDRAYEYVRVKHTHKDRLDTLLKHL